MDRKTRGCGIGRRARKIVNEQKTPAIAIEQRQAEVAPAVDERWCDLVLETLMRSQAVVASCLVPMPYQAARTAMDFSNEEKVELTLAMEEVLTTHADLVAEHRDAIALGVAVAAVHVVRVDKLMLLAGGDDAPSPRDAGVNLLILFGPLLVLLGLCALMQLLSER